MGWSTIQTPAKPKGLASIGVNKAGKVYVSLPSKILGAWDKVDRLVFMLGDGEHEGKVMICPASDENVGISVGITRFETHALIRIPGWNEGTRTMREHSTQVDYVVDAPNLIITLPAWALGPATEKPRDGGEGGKQAAPPASSPALGPHPEVRQVTRNGAALGHQPHAGQLAEADRQTELARKLPASKPSQTEPEPSWRRQADPNRPSMNNKISLVGSHLEAGGRVITLKGKDELDFATLLHKNQHRAVIDMEFACGNPDGICIAINYKLETAKAPILVAKEDGGFRFRWRET